MARRKRRSRARAYYRKIRNYAANKKIPLEVGFGLVSLPFMQTAAFASPYSYAKGGDYESTMRAFVHGFTGIDPQGVVKFDAKTALNPLNFNSAGMLKVLLMTGIASKVRKRIIRIPMGKIPLLGKWVS